MDLPTFTLVHVLISVLGIIAGLVVAGGLVAGVRPGVWTTLFLATTIFTSATGFGFPSNGVTPARVVGVLSLLLLAVCVVALYAKHLRGRWRDLFVVTAVAALYLNVFVLVVQLFARIPALSQLAPTQREAPFALAQALVLATFVWLGWAAWRGSRTPIAR